MTFRLPPLLYWGGPFAALGACAVLVGCSSTGGAVAPVTPGGSGPTAPASIPPSGTPSTGPLCLPGSGGIASAVSSAGGALTLTSTSNNVVPGGGSLTLTIGAGALKPAPSSVCFTYVPVGSLPAPVPPPSGSGANTYVAAFTVDLSGATLGSAASIAGAGVVPSQFKSGALNVAILKNGAWVNVGSASITAIGAFQSGVPTAGLPGVNQKGTYLVYAGPAPVVNFGLALIPDDGRGNPHGLQLALLEDNYGNALSAPASTYFPIAGEHDLDGSSLTADGTHGALVDGNNNVYFFNASIATGSLAISPVTINVGKYGNDGDSIVSLPGGDDVVVSPGATGDLVLIGGILGGSPGIVVAIPSSARGTVYDGLAISADGKVLLSRARGNVLDVYSVAGNGAALGDYTLSTTLTIADNAWNDGRDGMAISPTDPSRAVIVGTDPSGNPVAQLVTGLPLAPAVQALRLTLPATRTLVLPGLDLGELAPEALTLPTGATPYAVAINGDNAFVQTSAGIVTLSGVTSGSLAQVGSVYDPALTNLPPGASVCSLAHPMGTVGVTLDGKYVVALAACTGGAANPGTGVLLTIPIGAGGTLAAPAGQLNNVVTPDNDQLLVH